MMNPERCGFPMDRVVALIIIGLVVLLAGCGGLSGISAYETKMAGWGREDFWPIVAIEGAQIGRKSEIRPVKKPAEQVVREIGGATRQFSAGEKIRIVCAARTISPNCAVARGSSRTRIIAGRRSARSVWPPIRRERQPRTRSKEIKMPNKRRRLR